MAMRFVVLALVACSATQPAPTLSQRAAPDPARSPICRDGRSTASMPSDVLGYLDKNLVSRTIRNATGELYQCYASYLERGTQSGRLAAQFTILGDGSVGKAQVTGFDDSLANCVCEVIAVLTFPPTRGALISVHYPIVFRPAP